MTLTKNNIVLVVGAIIVVLLQLILAPGISVGGIAPNFLLAFCVALAIVAPGKWTLPLAVVLGLLYNLLAGGPVGSMAVCLVAGGYLVSKLFELLDSSSSFMPLVVILLSALLLNLLYALFMLMFFSGATFMQALIYRVVPCGIYDAIMAAFFYFCLRGLLNDDTVLDVPGQVRYR